MRVARVRIVNVRPKSGSNLRVFSGGKEIATRRVLKSFDAAVGHTLSAFGADCAGFVLIPWNHLGEFSTFITVKGMYPLLNDLPSWAAEAVRRHLAAQEARDVLSPL